MSKVFIKRLVIFSAILLSSTALFSQQLPLYSQYMMNDFYINPAIAGTKEYAPIVLGVHKQWVGIKEAPSTQTVSGHTSLYHSTMGLGGILFHDKYGPSSEIGLKVAYSYIFKITRHDRISLGLAAECYQYKLDERNFEPTWYDDPSLSYLIEKTIIPDATFGVYAYGKRYYASLSVGNLFQSKMKVNQNIKENKMVRHYFLYGGYRFNFDSKKKRNKVSDFEIEPSVLFKMTELTPLQADINLKFFIKQDYWFGFSVRTGEAFNTSDSFSVNIGVKHKQYFFGWTTDITVSDLSNYSWGSQEFIFGVNIGEQTKRHRSFF